MSFVESQAVFCDRAAACGLPGAILDAMKAEDIASFSKLAFCCNFSPGGPDDTPLIAVLTRLNAGVVASPSATSSFRRLFFESFSLAASELRGRLDRPEDQGPKKLPTPERHHRYTELQRRLGSAVKMEAEKEPSDALVDLCCSQHEDNRLQWISWDKLGKRDSELGGAKKSQAIAPDALGTLKLSLSEVHAPADLSSDLFLRYALQRRSLAYDMSQLFKYEDLELWNDMMFERRMREPVAGFAHLTVQQLMAADKFLFERMGRATRAGCIPTTAGIRPLDAVLDRCMNSAEVQMYLMPAQMTVASKTAAPPPPPLKRPLGATGRPLPDPNSKRQRKLAAAAASASKGAGGQKGKGKGKPAGKGGMPAGLAGGVPKDDEGRNICYGFNLDTCNDQNCTKGRHCCCKRGCFGEDHSFLRCPN